MWLSELGGGHEPKGNLFDSQTGHMPGLWAGSPVGGLQKATTRWCFSLSSSLSLSLKINEILKTKTKKEDSISVESKVHSLAAMCA